MQVNLKFELFKLFLFEFSLSSNKPGLKLKKPGDKVEKSPSAPALPKPK